MSAEPDRPALNDLHLPAGRLNLLPRAGGNLVRLDRNRTGDFPVAENLQDLAGTTNNAGFGQRVVIKFSAISLFQTTEIDNLVVGLKPLVIESAMGQLAVERHLATLKTDPDGTAGTRPLALVSAATCFAITGTDTDAFALAPMTGTGRGSKIM